MTIERRTVDVAVAHSVTTHSEFSYHTDAVDRLLVILPGRQYLASHPVLHYLKQAALQLGYDVLAVEYGFQIAPSAYAYDTINLQMLLEEARRPFRAVIDRGYKHICFAGKSMSTPVAVGMCAECPVQETRLILLTPIGDAVEKVGETETLVITGDADPLYSSELVSRDKRPNVSWRVYEGLNHGLENEQDWRASVAALQEITESCEDFLEKMESSK